MKKIITIISVILFAVGCKKELVEKPERLVERDKMIDIMYDLSLLEAIKYQNPMSLDSSDRDPTRFILKKYKVDSLQFVKSNMYYAADYNDYKIMFDEVGARLEKNKNKIDSVIKIEEKKKKLLKKKNKVVKKDSIKVKEELLKVKPDSIKRKPKLK
ncbi:DUF4296 domain-containing protein [Flavobacterium sp. ALJ2]|uniref:DUF4296 domain-containing protein n=1 Tax=Flavobacterium sp. ALJ2 TaxID=2786960 RepID=UPI00189D0D33|nr:DUF4296 domain-containing protein [Flavobacterium sp. ALJ2]MBF7091192.1 DUF4296 domain-containing protein [Flavobacterium sp. ALJ2]